LRTCPSRSGMSAWKARRGESGTGGQPDSLSACRLLGRRRDKGGGISRAGLGGEGVRLLRWLLMMVVSAGLFVGVWWLCQVRYGLDTQSSIALATAVATVVGAPLIWWASRDRSNGGQGVISLRTTVTVENLHVNEPPVLTGEPPEHVVVGEVPQEPPDAPGRRDYFTFHIEFVQSGKQLKVKAPRDMLVSAFLEEFREKLRDIFGPVGCASLHLYKHNLLLRSANGKFRPVRSSLTFREAGIDNGAVCRLRGYIRAEYTNIQLTLPSTKAWLNKKGLVWHRGRWLKKEETNFVILDEMDSIGLGEAEERGLLSPNALERVEVFSESPIDVVGWFVVLCPESDIEDDDGLGEKI
jgi:hypothetical protein